MKHPHDFIDFISRFGITDISITQRQEYRTPNYNSFYDYSKNSEPIYIRQESRPYIKCEIPQDRFEQLASIAEEWNELMQDSECARLLMEARFINRLKRGK